MTNAELRAALLIEAERGVKYAQSIAPVGEKEHRLKGGHIDRPGDYRDSIKGHVVIDRHRQKGRIEVTDYKARWIEYGTAKMPKKSVLRRTADYLGIGELGAVEDDE